MAIESGFFNSVNDDRLYNARDISRYFENILSNGIFKRITNCLQVSAASGMGITVAAGAGLIECQWFRASEAQALTVPAAHAVLPRIDNVVARLDFSEEVRAITLMVVSGTPAQSPAAVPPTRTATVYDLILARIMVPAGASAITADNITDTRADEEICGYVQSLVDTPVLKTINSRHVTAADNTTSIPINIAGLDYNVDILNVHINGFKLAQGIEYTVNADLGTITLVEAVDAGTIVDFEAYRPIMPDDIPDMADTVTDMLQEITTLRADVSNLQASLTAQASTISAQATQLGEIEPIHPGDFEFGEAFIVTGFASTQSTRIYFSIPFNRPILATTCTIKKMEVTARQSESYVLGSATSVYDIAGDIYSTRLSNNGMLTIVAEPEFTIAPFNNAEVSFYIEAGAVVTFT